MKTKNLFFVSFVSFAISIFSSGCASTPKVVGPPVVRGSTNYAVAQPPVQLDVASEGRQWNRFVRDYNAERLEHNLRMQGIEDRAAEQDLAKERGVTLQPPATSQPQAAATLQPLPQQTIVYPAQTVIYPYPNVVGGWSSGNGGFGGCGGNGFGSVPITQGTYRSSVRADWGPVRSGALGKAFRFLTRGEDFPGYRHTGGPAVVVRTYSAGGQVVGGGGFTSGLSFGWGR